MGRCGSLRLRAAARAGATACAVLLALVAPTSPGLAAPGDLTVSGCLSSDPIATGCAGIVTTNALTGLVELATSADGTSVYAVSETREAVVQLARDPETGSLTVAGCVTSDPATTGCAAIAAPAGTLDGVRAVAVSGDGAYVYAGSVGAGGGALVRLRRDAASGALTYVDCLSSAGVAAGCAVPPTTNALRDVAGLTAAGTGPGVYAASPAGEAVLQIGVSAAGLEVTRCWTTSAAATGCESVAALTGVLSGGLGRLATSPDGSSVYVAADASDAIAWFARDRDSGALAFAGCVAAGTGVGGCRSAAPHTNALEGMTAGSLAVSRDGTSVYVASATRAAIVHFARDPRSGGLALASCVTTLAATAGCTAAPATDALDGTLGLAVAPDGRTVHGVSAARGAVSTLARDPVTGVLAFRACVTSVPATSGCRLVAEPVLDGARAVALPADGRHVLVAGTALVRLEREPVVPGPPPPPPRDVAELLPVPPPSTGTEGPAPQAELRRTLARVHGDGAVGLRIACVGGVDTPCTGTVSVRMRGVGKLRTPATSVPVLLVGRTSYAVAGGEAALVRVALTEAGLEALRQRGRLPVRVVVVPDGGGRIERSVVLTRRRARAPAPIEERGRRAGAPSAPPTEDAPANGYRCGSRGAGCRPRAR